jgi:ribosomal protein L22
MSDETPKDAEPETPEADAAPEEAKPKPRRSRAKKGAEADAPAAEESAAEATEEEAPKPRRSRRKKADEETAPAEPVAEEAADAVASEEAAPAEPVAEEAADAVASQDADADEIEPTEDDVEAADEAASEEDLEEEAAPAARRRRGRGRRAAEDEEEAPAPTPRRAPQRAGGDRIGERVLVRAQAKYVRTSARKARLVCDHIRGKSVQEARAILAHTPRAVARDWSKLLESAVANAEHNHELLGDDLRIASVTADEGPTLKRFRPRAMGRATRIRKRTSHLTILLTPKES